MTADQEAVWKQVEDVANKEGTFTLYSLGSIPQNQSETLQQLFAKDYPNIKLNYLFVGRSSEEAARVTAEQQSKNYTADVLDSSFRSALVLDHSFLEAFVPPASQDKSVKWVCNPIASSQPPNLVSSSAATFFAIWINKDLLDPADAPKNFMDVASNPKWKGLQRRPGRRASPARARRVRDCSGVDRPHRDPAPQGWATHPGGLAH